MINELKQIYRTVGGRKIYLWPFVGLSVIINLAVLIDALV